MDKESTASVLSSEQLARLLKIGSDTSQAESEVDEEQKKADFLRDWLSASLPLETALVESLPKILRRLYRELRPLAGKPFGRLLQDPKTEIVAIKKIKDYSKNIVRTAKSEVEYDVAVVVYYAAIASALVLHNQRITSFSYENLRNSFSTLLEHNWLTPNLIRLFKKAYKLCQKKAKRGKQGTVG